MAGCMGGCLGGRMSGCMGGHGEMCGQAHGRRCRHAGRRPFPCRCHNVANSIVTASRLTTAARPLLAATAAAVTSHNSRASCACNHCRCSVGAASPLPPPPAAAAVALSGPTPTAPADCPLPAASADCALTRLERNQTLVDDLINAFNYDCLAASATVRYVRLDPRDPDDTW
eukprot:355760-Chlamydomonas_euryale.AAC.2